MTTKLPRMNGGQLRHAQKLIRKLCANCDSGNCILLDDGFNPCVCPQLLTSAVVCRYFRAAVLPADRELYTELTDNLRSRKRCRICGQNFIAGSNRAIYCPNCAERERRRKTRIRVRRHRGKT